MGFQRLKIWLRHSRFGVEINILTLKQTLWWSLCSSSRTFEKNECVRCGAAHKRSWHFVSWPFNSWTSLFKAWLGQKDKPLGALIPSNVLANTWKGPRQQAVSCRYAELCFCLLRAFWCLCQWKEARPGFGGNELSVRAGNGGRAIPCPLSGAGQP